MTTPGIEAEITTKVTLTLEQVAAWFANLDDDSQARFFVEVAKAAKNWKSNSGLGASWQWYQIGSHLKNCECATEEAREIVRAMHEGLCNGTH